MTDLRFAFLTGAVVTGALTLPQPGRAQERGDGIARIVSIRRLPTIRAPLRSRSHRRKPQNGRSR